jgi:hypothetical protein
MNVLETVGLSFVVIVSHRGTSACKIYNSCIGVIVVVVYERIIDPEPPYYRPSPDVEDKELDPTIIKLMKQCWAEQPCDRPSFEDIAKILKYINKGK